MGRSTSRCKNWRPTTAQFLVKHVIHRHGCPVNIVTNNGSNFTSDIVRDIMELLKVNMKFVAPYRPQANGICERLNGTLVQIIRKLAAHYNLDWDLVVPNAIFAYNLSYHLVTNNSPFQLLYGCEPSTPSTLYPLLVERGSWRNRKISLVSNTWANSNTDRHLSITITPCCFPPGTW